MESFYLHRAGFVAPRIADGRILLAAADHHVIAALKACDTLDARQALTLAEPYQSYALGIAANNGNIRTTAAASSPRRRQLT